MVRIAVMCAILIGSCNSDHQLEKDFFHGHGRADRVERMRQYSLEDQYKIFRYGNDWLEPPQLELVRPLAEKGSGAIPFLTEQLRSSTDDLAVRDILFVLETMVDMKTYDVKADSALLNILEGRINTMKTQYWQSYARGKLLLLRDRGYTLRSPEPVLLVPARLA